MFETRIYFSYWNNHELESIIQYINTVLKGYTLFKAIGYYNNESEVSRVIEIIHDKIDLSNKKIREIAKVIREIANQESVLITTKSINVEFI